MAGLNQASFSPAFMINTSKTKISVPSTLAHVLLVFLIAVVYAVIQPLILPAALVFFAIANVVYTTVLTSSSKSLYESSGRFLWASSYRCIMLGLCTAQLTLMGVLLIKRGYAQQLPMWLLVFATVYFAYKIERRYYPQMSNVSVHLTSLIDSERRNMRMMQVRPDLWQYGAVRPGYREGFRDDFVVLYSYKHPVLEEPAELKPSTSHIKCHNTDFGSTNNDWGESKSYGTV